MNELDRLAPNTDEVVAKTLEGEVIIINLTTGAYYSTAGVGAAIWQAIERRQSEPEIVSHLLRAYEVTEDTARADVARLLREFREEDLIVDMPGDTAVILPETTPEVRQSYEAPVIDIYRDMRDMLALDPPMPVLGAPPPGSSDADR